MKRRHFPPCWHLASAVVYYALAYVVMWTAPHDWLSIGLEMAAVMVAVILAVTWRLPPPPRATITPPTRRDTP